MWRQLSDSLKSKLKLLFDRFLEMDFFVEVEAYQLVIRKGYGMHLMEGVTNYHLGLRIKILITHVIKIQFYSEIVTQVARV